MPYGKVETVYAVASGEDRWEIRAQVAGQLYVYDFRFNSDRLAGEFADTIMAKGRIGDRTWKPLGQAALSRVRKKPRMAAGKPEPTLFEGKIA